MGSSRHVFRSGDFDAPDLAGRRKGRRVSVCIPARNEEATVGAIVATVVGACTAAGGGPDLVDEVLVVDDGSTDATAAVARGAGALVVSGQGAGGKGEAMALGAARAGGELLVFLDADVEAFTPSFVVGLLGPLVLDDDIVLVKGFYERPLHGAPSGGGRVTELMARPVIDLLFPQLAFVRQPLAGETAIRRTALEKTGIAPGYGAELGLLVDVTREFGVDALAEVDLGTRVHRNRPLSELRHHATDVLRCALERAPR